VRFVRAETSFVVHPVFSGSSIEDPSLPDYLNQCYRLSARCVTRAKTSNCYSWAKLRPESPIVLNANTVEMSWSTHPDEPENALAAKQGHCLR
jgi:hypothetical protein